MVAGKCFDQVARLVDLLGVQPGSRLIQNEYLRIVNDSLRQADPLAVAFRQFSEQLVLHVPDRAALANRIDALAQLDTRKPLKPPHKSEVLCGPHFQIKRRRLRQIAYAPFDFEWRFEDVKTGNCRRTRTWWQKARQYPHGGRLAGAVWSQKADDLSLLDLEGDVIHCRVSRIPLGKIFHADHRFFFFWMYLFTLCVALVSRQLRQTVRIRNNILQTSGASCQYLTRTLALLMSASE